MLSSLLGCPRTDARTEPALADPGKPATSVSAIASASAGAQADAGGLGGLGIGHGHDKPPLCSNGTLLDDAMGIGGEAALDAGLGSAPSTVDAVAAPSASALPATAKRHLTLFGTMRIDVASPETNALVAKLCDAFSDLKACARTASLPYGRQQNDLSIDLAPSGKVLHVAWTPSAAPFDAGFAGCVERTISALTFDADAKGGARSFRYGLEVTVSSQLEVRVALVSPTITGAIPAGAVERIVRQRLPPLRRCYESARKRDPGIEGTITTAFVIDATGAATKVHTTPGTITDAAMSACVHDVFTGLAFPVPAKGTVAVTMPLSFTME